MISLIAAELSLGLDMLIGIGTMLVGAGGAWAVVKYKTEGAMKRIEDNKEDDKQLAAEVRSLGESLSSGIKDVEKTMVGKIEALKDAQNEVTQKVTLIENDLSYVKKEQERHSKKITLFGQMAPKDWSK
jgi:hypothetical protein